MVYLFSSSTLYLISPHSIEENMMRLNYEESRLLLLYYLKIRAVHGQGFLSVKFSTLFWKLSPRLVTAKEFLIISDLSSELSPSNKMRCLQHWEETHYQFF